MKTPERYRSVKRIFVEACNLESAERSRYLDRVCHDDPILRKDVVQLLAAHEDRQARFGTIPAAWEIEDANDQSESAKHCMASQLPDRVGPYKICGMLGEGGMGVVYKAVQESPQRTVALKVLRPGLMSHNLLRRFEFEAEVLGRLQHPGIAQIFEAGTATTDHGTQPFFAMELVEGCSLGEYSERHQLGMRVRLGLFVRICRAVHHAHLKGVIHRDLKPSNILVTESGEPKILDFGIARATDSDLQTTTLKTDVGQLVGTIPYMSPEQVSGRGEALDHRSDVYSLGVIAYELLSGKLPYDLAGHSIPEALRIIERDDPAALTRSSRIYRGDLETIVAKSLTKERAHRYQSAEAFGADIERFLQNKPIQARPPSTAYQMRKLIARHKTPFALATLLFVATVVFSLFMSVLYARSQTNLHRALDAEKTAAAEAETAKTEATRARTVSGFLSDMLISLDPDITRGRDTTVLRELIDAAAKNIATDLADQPDVKATIHLLLGTTYRSLDLMDDAEKHLEAAYKIRMEISDENHVETLTAMHDLALLRDMQERYDEAEALGEKALALRRRLLGNEHKLTLATMNNLALVYTHQGRIDDSEALMKETLDLSIRLLGADHRRSLTAKNNLGRIYHLKGQLDDAESIYLQVLEARRRLYGHNNSMICSSMNNLAAIYRLKKKYDKAEPLFRETLALQRQILGDEHGGTLRTMGNLALVLAERGRYDDAESLYQETLEIKRRLHGAEKLETIITMSGLGSLYNNQGKFEQAATILGKTVEISRRILPADHWQIGTFLKQYGVTLTGLRRFRDAERALLEGQQISLEALGPSHIRAKVAIQAIVNLYASWEAEDPGGGYAEKAAAWQAKLPGTIESKAANP